MTDWPAAGAPAGPRSSVLDRLISLRDRLLADPGFQRWASRFPPTRGVARRRARSLFDLCAGFVYSQVLAACLESGLLALLAQGPLPGAEVARRLSLPERPATTLLEAAAALRLVGRRRGGYGLGTLGAALLGNPGAQAMIAHHGMLYADLADPLALLRGETPPGRLAAFWPYASGSTASLTAAEAGPYSALMTASQTMVAEQILDAYPLGRHRRLLDVAGGEGTFLTAAAQRAPALDLVLFDLPAVAEQARRRLAGGGLTGRLKIAGGDLHTDPLPSGADVASLVRVVHDHGDEAALAILRATHRALPPGGTLLLAEPMAGTPGAEGMGAYFGFYLLAMGSGRPRRVGELDALLRRAGFGNVREARTALPLVTRLLVATA